MEYVTITLKKHRYPLPEAQALKEDPVLEPICEPLEVPSETRNNSIHVSYRSVKLAPGTYSSIDYSRRKAYISSVQKAVPQQVVEIKEVPKKEEPNPAELSHSLEELIHKEPPAVTIHEIPETPKEPAVEVIKPLSKKELRRQKKEEKKDAKVAKKEAKRVAKMEKKLGRDINDQPVDPVPEEPTKKKRSKKSSKTKEQLKEKSKGSLKKPEKKKFSLYNEVIDEEKTKHEKIDKLINQDGYYDAIPTIDEANRVVVKKSKNGKIGILAALIASAVALVVILVVMIVSMF